MITGPYNKVRIVDVMPITFALSLEGDNAIG